MILRYIRKNLVDRLWERSEQFIVHNKSLASIADMFTQILRYTDFSNWYHKNVYTNKISKKSSFILPKEGTCQHAYHYLANAQILILICYILTKWNDQMYLNSHINKNSCTQQIFTSVVAQQFENGKQRPKGANGKESKWSNRHRKQILNRVTIKASYFYPDAKCQEIAHLDRLLLAYQLELRS